MSVRIGTITIDTNDMDRARTFWQDVTGYEVTSSDNDNTYLHDPAKSGPGLALQRVPEAATGKNRLHLDLTTDDLAGEVRRIRGLGAGEVKSYAESGWVVLADPDGNQFCVCAE
jgi:predicted enzyme related to lactoylglutathione lyase